MTTQGPLPQRNALAAGVAGAPVLATGVADAAPSSRGRAVSRSVLPSDRQGFNRRWFASRLERVYVPTRAEDVAICLEEAVARHGRDVKVVSGRHCYEGFVYNESTTSIIDMSGISRAGFDPERRAFFVDAGCDTWSGYRMLLNGHGRTLPGGSCASVGAGGHISGGGYGLLSRAHGLSVDHVTGIDVVTWEDAQSRATLRHVSAASRDPDERDLFWALRGGGAGSFGVVVRYWFANPPVAPAYASLWSAGWDWADLNEKGFARLLMEYADWVSGMPRRHFSVLSLGHAAAGRIGLTLQVASSPGADARRHIGEVETAIAAAQRRFSLAGSIRQQSRSVQHLTFLESLWTLSGNGPNQFGKHKSSYLRTGMPADHVEAMHAWLRTTPDGLTAGDMAQSLVQVSSYGGAVNDVSPSTTPVPQRSSLLRLQFQTYWNNDSRVGASHRSSAASQEEGHLQWIRGLYSDTYVAGGGRPDPSQDTRGIVDGCYLNYPDVDLGTHADGGIERALRLYFGDNYRRNRRNLVSVKHRWDPTDLFRHAQSIPPR